MRRPPQHRAALVGWSVAGAQAGADVRDFEAALVRHRRGAFQRLLEVEADVIGECFQRRNIQHRNFILEHALLGLNHEAIDRRHEGGQRFATAGGRAKEHIMARGLGGVGDDRPAQFLRARGGIEAALEPGADYRVEALEDGGHSRVIARRWIAKNPGYPCNGSRRLSGYAVEARMPASFNAAKARIASVSRWSTMAAAPSPKRPAPRIAIEYPCSATNAFWISKSTSKLGASGLGG